MFESLTTSRRRLRRGTRAFTREVDSGAARVFVDHGFQWDGSNNVWLTRARACFVMQAGPRFDLRPRSLLSRVVGLHGGVPDDDPYFADFFVVRTNHAEMTWRALTTHVRSLLAGSFEDARLISDGRMITLWREGEFGREVDAQAAVEIVGEIARFQLEALDAFARVPGATYAAPTGPWDQRTPPSFEVHTPTVVRIEPIAREGRPVTSITGNCGRSTPPFAIAVDNDGRVHGACDVLPTGVAGAVPDVGRSAIRCDGSTVRLEWPGLETRKSALIAGAHLIGSLAASHSQGLYR